MRHLKRNVTSVAAASAATVGLLFAGVGSASAATTFPNANYGFDGNANLIVGGGSTTLFYMAQQLANLWDDTSSCTTNNSSYAPTSGSTQSYPQAAPGAFNQCNPTTQTQSGGSAGGNYDGDTVAIATPAGSSTGIASLNGYSAAAGTGTYAYEGTNASIPTSGDANSQNGLSNGYGTVDFAMSSRAGKTSGGNCAGGNELAASCDTFWGVASDGVSIFTFNSSAGAYASNSGGFSAQDLYNIYEDVDTTWGQLPEWQAETSAYDSANGTTSDPNLPASNAPIVPYAMNSTSGTFADFVNWVKANASSSDPNLSSFSPNTYGRELSNGSGTNNVLPLENDVKPLIVDAENNGGTYAGQTYAAGISTSATSVQNPVNWIWFGSYGLLNKFPYLSGGTVGGTTFSTAPVPVAYSGDTTNGITPSPGNIANGTYPIPRTLSFVTKTADATCPVVNSACNLNGGPTNGNGNADANVNGATSGKGGAVREFMRFLCRKTTSLANPTDPYTGNSLGTEIQTAISNSGFEAIPVASRSANSACNVQS